MADFSRRKGLERWIEARPVATRQRDATILASRAALRVWPLLGGGLNRRGEPQFGELIFAGARANALAWAAAKYPARANELRFAYSAYAASARIATAADGSAGSAYASAVAAASAAYFPASADLSADFSADFAAARAAAAATAAADAAADAADARAAVLRMVPLDASFLEGPREADLQQAVLIDYP
jgi:hypothetical protein